MPQFRFRALAADGRRVHGRIEAEDADRVRARLADQGLMPVEVASCVPLAVRLQAWWPRRRRNLPAVLLRQLATLLAAGERLDAALLSIAAECPDRRLARLLHELRERVRAGRGFARALADSPELEERELVAVAAVGEAAGRLPAVLADLATSRGRREAFARRIRGALLYPFILALASLFAVLFVLVGVVPRFDAFLAGREAELPAFARAVFALSRGLRTSADVLALALAVLALSSLVVARLPAARRAADRLQLRLPLFSTHARERIAAEFARALAVLGGSGVELPRAVGLAADAVTNTAARVALRRVAGELREGRSLASALAATSLLPHTALGLLRAGEESGRLSVMAGFLADHYEERLCERTERFVRLLEPCLVIGVGIVVAGIIGAVASALLSLPRFAT